MKLICSVDSGHKRIVRGYKLQDSPRTGLLYKATVRMQNDFHVVNSSLTSKPKFEASDIISGHPMEHKTWQPLVSEEG